MIRTKLSIMAMDHFPCLSLVPVHDSSKTLPSSINQQPRSTIFSHETMKFSVR